MTDRNALVQNFTAALGELVTRAMRDLLASDPEKMIGVTAAVNSGTAKMQIAVDTDPITIVGVLRSTTDATPIQEIFRIIDMPKDEAFN